MLAGAAPAKNSMSASAIRTKLFHPQHEGLEEAMNKEIQPKYKQKTVLSRYSHRRVRLAHSVWQEVLE